MYFLLSTARAPPRRLRRYLFDLKRYNTRYWGHDTRIFGILDLRPVKIDDMENFVHVARDTYCGSGTKVEYRY